MMGGVDVFGGSERTTVEVGFGGATGANDVVSARKEQRRRLRIVLLCAAMQCPELVVVAAKRKTTLVSRRTARLQ